ncbi:hypothetical protein CR513_15746, partial [Mucuna pruriens]
MALSEYDIIYVSQKAIKGSALAEHLAYHPLENPQPLLHEFPNDLDLAKRSVLSLFGQARVRLYQKYGRIRSLHYRTHNGLGTLDKKA